MSDSFKLYRLQQVDLDIDKSNKRLVDIDKLLKDDQELNIANINRDNTKSAVQSAAKELKSAEDDVAAQQIKVDQNQSRLYSGRVTNPKALQDLQVEAKSFKDTMEALENIQLEKMLDTEQKQEDLISAESNLSQVETKVEIKNSSLVEERSEVRVTVDQFSEERNLITSGIPNEDLKLYEELRKKRKGVAVAKVTDKTCSACGTNLTEALAQAARSRSKIIQCGNCFRILYSG